MPTKLEFGPCSLTERMRRRTLICSIDMRFGLQGITEMFRQDILNYMGMFLWHPEPLGPYLSGEKILPEKSVVYFVTDERHELQYIGKAQNIRCRWKNHQLTAAVGEQIHRWGIEWWLVRHADAAMVELVLIQALRPRLNKRFN
jgi:hypothetical protein